MSVSHARRSQDAATWPSSHIQYVTTVRVLEVKTLQLSFLDNIQKIKSLALLSKV